MTGTKWARLRCVLGNHKGKNDKEESNGSEVVHHPG